MAVHTVSFSFSFAVPEIGLWNVACYCRILIKTICGNV